MAVVPPRRIVSAIEAGAVALAWFLVFAPGVARAQYVPNVLVNTYSTNYPDFGRFPNTTVDGVATGDSYVDGWLTNNTSTGNITWSLNGRQTLSTIDVYNYRDQGPGGEVNRGAQSIDVQISNDYGQTFSSLGTFTANEAPGVGTNTPTTFSLGSVTATNVKFNITSNYGDAYMGLNEVAFYGTAAKLAAPVTLSYISDSSELSPRVGSRVVDGIIESTDGNVGMWLSNFNDHTGGGPSNPGTPTITLGIGDGSTPQVLDHLNIWNYNESTLPGRGLNDIAIELFNGAADLGLAVNDADGTTTFHLNDAKGLTMMEATMDTLGLRDAPLATSFKIIGLTNTGTDNGLGGLTEVEAFVDAPEPASLGLLAIGGIMLLKRRHRT